MLPPRPYCWSRDTLPSPLTPIALAECFVRGCQCALVEFPSARYLVPAVSSISGGHSLFADGRQRCGYQEAYAPWSLTAALLVDVLVDDLVPGVSAPCTQLAQLVLRILAFIICADARVNSYAHLDGLRLRE